MILVKSSENPITMVIFEILWLKFHETPMKNHPKNPCDLGHSWAQPGQRSLGRAGAVEDATNHLRSALRGLCRCLAQLALEIRGENMMEIWLVVTGTMEF